MVRKAGAAGIDTVGEDAGAERTTEAGAQLDPTIEEHAKTLDVPAWQLAGLRRLRRWGEGKRVPLEEFAGELHRFLNGPMNQRRG